jgi:hypothetical protein
MNNITLNNQFHFTLPDIFIPDELEERYIELLGSKRKLYTRVIDYINSSIQTITFPGINFPTVSNPQNLKRKKIKWKTVGNIYDLYDETITITFLSVDANINYMIIHDILSNHYLNTDDAYDQNVLITAVDENKDAIYHISFRDVIWTGIGDNTFAYNDQTVQNKTFTVTFVYNFIDFMYVKDKKDVISGNSYSV